jgi:Secretion system C-terminal sorting domain
MEFCKSTSIDDEELAVFESLPNPITNHLQIEDKYNLINQVEIIDIYGNVVRSSIAHSAQFYIETGDLKGFYIVNVTMKNGQSAKRKVLIF